jgi:hypothetical protein
VAENERAKLKAEILEGKLAIPGDERTYISGAIAFRSLWLEVTDLGFQQHTQRIDGIVHGTPRLRGTANLMKDHLQLARWGDICHRLPLSIRPAPEVDDGRSDLAWTAFIGFIPADWELRSSDEWYCEVLVPVADFQAMLVAYETGKLKRFSVAIKPDAWICDGDQYTPIGYGVTWYLVPRESTFPELSKGVVQTFGWNDVGQPLGSDNEDKADQAPGGSVGQGPSLPPQADSLVLAAGIERLRKTIMQGGLIVAGAIFIGWFV